MKTFKFESGTQVVLTGEMIHIKRSNDRSIGHLYYMSDFTGDMSIRLSEITGVYHDKNHLLIFGSGLPAPSDFKNINPNDNTVKYYPNYLVAKSEELRPLYEAIIDELSKR